MNIYNSRLYNGLYGARRATALLPINLTGEGTP